MNAPPHPVKMAVCALTEPTSTRAIVQLDLLETTVGEVLLYFVFRGHFVAKERKNNSFLQGI